MGIMSVALLRQEEEELQDEDEIQVLARVNHEKTHVLNFHSRDDDLSLEGIKKVLSQVLGLSSSRCLTFPTNSIIKEGCVWWISCMTRVPVVGGKGGFGTLLKGQSKQAGAKRTIDFGACRDLNGRRLRHVNDEIKLQKWRSSSNTSATEDTPSGIRNWHLPIPHWSELHTQSSKVKRHVQYQQQKEARRISEKNQIREEKSKLQKQQHETAIQHYIQPVLQSSTSTMQHVVQMGLKASYSDSKKRKRTTTTTNNPIYTSTSSSSSWCVISGDVVVHDFKDDAKIRFHSMSEFATVALPTVPLHEEMYYEVTIQTAGLAQIGWATHEFHPNSQNGDGVGDDAHSYGYDGFRCAKFHDAMASYGTSWRSNDVISCHLDTNQNITYYHNGKSLGLAFSFDNTCSIFPAISLNEGEILDVNIGPNFQFKNNISKDSIHLSDSLVTIQTEHNPVSDDDQTKKGQSHTKEERETKNHATALHKKSTLSNNEHTESEEPKKKSDKDFKATHGEKVNNEDNSTTLTTITIKDLDDFPTVDELKKLGLDTLKASLYQLGLKCGGSLEDRAARLFQIKGATSIDDVPLKLRGKNFDQVSLFSLQ